jgi:copper transport protein
MLGHASEAGSQTPLTVAADAVHLLAAALWLGGLAAILAMLWRQEPSEAVVTAVRRFSPFAAGCVAILAATGLYQAYLRIETPAAILTTGYGRLLVAKVALVAAVLAVASRTRAHLHRGPTIALRRLVAAETGGALVVLALTAALVESQPAIQQYAARPVRLVASGPGNFTLRLPNTARGLDTGDLTVRSADGHPRDVPELRATWAQPVRGIGPLPARLTRTGIGRYRATWAPLPVDGSWQFAVTIRTSDIDEATTSIRIHIR